MMISAVHRTGCSSGSSASASGGGSNQQQQQRTCPQRFSGGRRGSPHRQTNRLLYILRLPEGRRLSQEGRLPFRLPSGRSRRSSGSVPHGSCLAGYDNVQGHLLRMVEDVEGTDPSMAGTQIMRLCSSVEQARSARAHHLPCPASYSSPHLQAQVGPERAHAQRGPNVIHHPDDGAHMGRGQVGRQPQLGAPAGP